MQAVVKEKKTFSVKGNEKDGKTPSFSVLFLFPIDAALFFCHRTAKGGNKISVRFNAYGYAPERGTRNNGLIDTILQTSGVRIHPSAVGIRLFAVGIVIDCHNFGKGELAQRAFAPSLGLLHKKIAFAVLVRTSK